MNTYKITFTYSAPKGGFLRSGALIVDAENEAVARAMALNELKQHRHGVITKITLYATQTELPLDNTTGQRKK